MSAQPSERRTVHVVDSDAALRHQISEMLQSVQIDAKEHASAAEFTNHIEVDGGDCAIIAMRMPYMSGLDTLRWLRERGHHLPVIMISGHGDADSAMAAMRQGAADFMTKPFSEQLLLERVLHTIATERERRQVAALRDDAEARLEQLTDRERQIVSLIVAGYATKQIAVRLGISYKTVENRRRHIHDKLQVDGLAELVGMVVPLLGGCCATCRTHECASGTTACGLTAGDRIPCRLNPRAAHQSVCPLAGPKRGASGCARIPSRMAG